MPLVGLWGVERVEVMVLWVGGEKEGGGLVFECTVDDLCL